MTMKVPSAVVEAVSSIDAVPIDSYSIPQSQLDLINKTRMSAFPWRGQFTPELVEVLLKSSTQSIHRVLDPFAGSGTTLFEAVRLGFECYGAEINPAAYLMARTAEFSCLGRAERDAILFQAKSLVDTIGSEATHAAKQSTNSLQESLKKIMSAARADGRYYQPLALAVLLALGDGGHGDVQDLRDSLARCTALIRSLPEASSPCKVFLSDARQLPLDDGFVDLVITSPPYINVFNYHQNFRPGVEMLGWNVLEVARSEIGSNRKNRGNRFLTVVQYCLDMYAALTEIRRTLRNFGRAIIVIGRESNVRGVPFSNSRILGVLAIYAGFLLENWRERRFTNRFGKTIVEDLLFLRSAGTPGLDTQFPRDVARHFLSEALVAAKQDIAQDISIALESASQVESSPIYTSEDGSDLAPDPRSFEAQ